MNEHLQYLEVDGEGLEVEARNPNNVEVAVLAVARVTPPPELCDLRTARPLSTSSTLPTKYHPLVYVLILLFVLPLERCPGICDSKRMVESAWIFGWIAIALLDDSVVVALGIAPPHRLTSLLPTTSRLGADFLLFL